MITARRDNVSKAAKELQIGREALMKLTIRNLTYIGEAAVKIARQKGSYQDRTGNLRSSVGYIVVQDGQMVASSSFAAVKQGSQGSNKGLIFAQSLVSNFPKGVALVLVAGMQYASYVAGKGRDVLDAASVNAEQQARKLVKFLYTKK